MISGLLELIVRAFVVENCLRTKWADQSVVKHSRSTLGRAGCDDLKKATSLRDGVSGWGLQMEE